MNVFNVLQQEVIHAVHALYQSGQIASDPNTARVAVEPPRDAAHGDAATNAALVLAGQVKMSARDFATLLAAELQKSKTFASVDIAGAGFLNMKMSNDFWYQQLKAILKEGDAYGNSDMGGGEKVNVEFVSVNPTGPMHVGHVRGAVFGDALASLLAKAGYDVCREYYMNDRGAQMDKLAQSAYLRYREAMGEEIGPIPEGYYPADYLKEVGSSIASSVGDKYMKVKEEDCHDFFRDTACDIIMGWIKRDLAAAGIHFDVFTSEKAIAQSGGIEKALNVLKGRNLIYHGILDKPKSAKAPDDWLPQEMTIFKSTLFGDEADRPLIREDGSYTYFMPDIAYQYDKYMRGFKKLVMVLGADHAGYVRRLSSAVDAVTNGQADLQCKLTQMVSFSQDGQPVKMSKRAGTLVYFSDLLDELGKDVVRFYMLSRKNDTQMDFDFVKVKEQSKDNPVFYVQYANARANSVFRHATDMFGKDVLKGLDGANLALLTDEAELALIRLLAGFVRQIEQAAEAYEPHRITYYLYDLASAFHALWNKGRDDVQMRFLDADNKELSRARLALITAVTNVIAAGLSVFGVIPAKEM